MSPSRQIPDTPEAAGEAALPPAAPAGGAREPESPPQFRRPSRPVRVRRAASWRQRWGAGRRWILLLALLLIGAAGCFGVSHWVRTSPRFALQSVRQIAISGAPNVDRKSVLECFASDIGRSLFAIPLARRQAELERLAWVRSATVERIWPNRLNVRLNQRVPVAMARVNGDLKLVDAEGVFLPRVPGNFNLPVLSGLAGGAAAQPVGPDAERRQRQMQLYLQLVSELDQGGAHHSLDFSEIDLSNPDDLKATILPAGISRPVILRFGVEHFWPRYQLVLAHLPQWLQSFPNLRAVDLRYRGQAILDTGSETQAVKP